MAKKTDEGRRQAGSQMQLYEWHLFRLFPFNVESSNFFSYRHPSSVSPAGSEVPSWLTASPRGKPRGRKLKLLPFTEPLYPGNGRAATSRPYRCGGSRGWRQEQGYVPSTPLRKQRYCAALGDTSALLSFTNPLLLHLSQSTSTFCCKLPEKQPYFL